MKYTIPFILLLISCSNFAADNLPPANQKQKKSQLIKLVRVAVPVCTVLATIGTYAYIKHQQIPDLNSISVIMTSEQNIKLTIDSKTDCLSVLRKIAQETKPFPLTSVPELNICYKKYFYSFNNTSQYVGRGKNIQEIIQEKRSNIFELFFAI